jgi:hypothetical protein
MGRRKAKTENPPVKTESVVEATTPTKSNADSNDPSPDSPSSGDGSSFVIAEGCALTGTRRGLLSEGDVVAVQDLLDGQEGLDRWIKAGFIVKKEQ